MSNDTQHTPADVRDRIIRASTLPIEDEETMIAGLRAGAEAVERGELDAEEFAGIWSQYLRELFRRASSVPAPADVRERVKEPTQAQIDDACMWYRHDFGLLSEKERDSVRFEARQWFRAWGKALSDGDDYAALLRTPRGEEEAWCAFLDALDEFEAAANLWADPEGPTAADMERLRQSRQRVIECARILTTIRPEAQGEDRWEDLIFSTLIEAYDEAQRAARRSDAQGEEV